METKTRKHGPKWKLNLTCLGFKFALDTLELVVGVDVVAEGGPRVRGEGAQVAVVDLGEI